MVRLPASELGLPVTSTPVDMPRKKHPKLEERLTRLVGVRLRQEDYEKFEAMLHSTNCHSVGELLRSIILKERIYFRYIDATMDIPVEELARIHSEINRIGVNINQLTHQFHDTDGPLKKVTLALKVERAYKEVGVIEKELLAMISQFSERRNQSDFLKDGYRLGEFKVLRVPQKPAKD
jgi:hypothetical protein